MDRADVCVLLPTYNEAETIAEVVDGYRNAGFTDVLVIDGDSDDDTRTIAADHGAEIVVQTGTGKGQAVREAVTEYVDAPYVLLADADATYRPDDADAMLAPLEEGYEHVVGDRFADMKPGAMTFLNRAGNRIVNRAFSLIHGDDYGDILSGYRAFTRRSFERMTLTADGFGIETEMSVECAKKAIPTAVVPISYHPRPNGSDTNLRPFRDGGIIFLELYRRAKTNNPLFYFGSAGAISGAVGLVLAAYVGYEWFIAFPRRSHEVIAIGAALAIIFGVQLLIFGVLSDMIASFHRELLNRIDEVADAAGVEDHGSRHEPRERLGDASAGTGPAVGGEGDGERTGRGPQEATVRADDRSDDD